MTQKKTHDLYDFLRQISAEMSAEYNRIQMRATEDPGTAGDQGEENWAEILRGWLPRSYEVVTKGRIISHEGLTSPQIDVLVLNGAYPRKLLNKKLYLAAGVAAAFECKTTLKASHVSDAMQRCAKIKSLYPTRIGTPYKELHSPLVYGLLTHSHSWRGKKSTAEETINRKLREADALHVPNPRLRLDMLCVANLGTWTSSTITFLGPNQVPAWPEIAPNSNGSVFTGYVGHTRLDGQAEQFTPMGVFVWYLSQQLAWENRALRDLADYYRLAKIAGTGKGYMRTWPISIYSADIRSRVENMPVTGEAWDEWSLSFPR